MPQTSVPLRPGRALKELPDDAYEAVLRDGDADEKPSSPAPQESAPASSAVYPDFGADARQGRSVKGSKTVRLEANDVKAIEEMADGLGGTTESKLMAIFIQCVLKKAYPVYKEKGAGALLDYISEMKKGNF